MTQSLRLALHLAGGFLVVGTLNTADRLVEEAESLRADVVMLDLDMPGADPFLALGALSRRVPGSRVLVVSGLTGESFVERAMASGALGFVSKQEPVETLIEGARRVAEGHVFLSRAVTSLQLRVSPAGTAVIVPRSQSPDGVAAIPACMTTSLPAESPAVAPPK